MIGSSFNNSFNSIIFLATSADLSMILFHRSIDVSDSESMFTRRHSLKVTFQTSAMSPDNGASRGKPCRIGESAACSSFFCKVAAFTSKLGSVNDQVLTLYENQGDRGFEHTLVERAFILLLLKCAARTSSAWWPDRINFAPSQRTLLRALGTWSLYT